MSESILSALLQLFAIISEPDDGRPSNRRKIVEAFLKRQLGQHAVIEYLQSFDLFYEIHQEKIKSKRAKRTSSSSVRVLKICNEINEELTQKQKVIVLLHLLEFIKNEDRLPSDQEIEFVYTVSVEFNITEEEYHKLSSFVLDQYNNLRNDKDIAVVSKHHVFQELGPEIKLVASEGLDKEIFFLHIISANIYFLKYTGSNEIFLNGQLIDNKKIQIFSPGSSIRNPKIKPVFYSDIARLFLDRSLIQQTEFEVKDLQFKFPGGKVGINKMSFISESGRLVGIMGASGAGKSTLLNILNGSQKPTKGHVTINGFDVHSDKESMEGLIGFVSQDDLLMEDLTVFQNLYYNTRLCYGNYSREKTTELVEESLKSLGLYEIRDMKVGSTLNKKISGGQRKRLNIALELIREPAVLFLDEPTSGLSSSDSENILDLLKELTFKGKLVFVVIHQPSSDIFKTFDRLLILDEGGYLIYNGPPVESIIYFKSRIQHANWNESVCKSCGNVNPEQIFNIVETKVLDEYGNNTAERKIEPDEWNDFFKFSDGNKELAEPEKKEIPEINFKIPNKFIQFLIFVKRDLISKFSNKQYVLVNFFEAPLMAFLLSFLIKYFNVSNKTGYIFRENSNLPVYIFMSVIVAIFIGLSVSAEEIIKDRKIQIRESFLNLSRGSYLMSKVAILLSISAVQAFLFTLIGNTIIEINGMFWYYWLALFSAWASSNILGLIISDSFKTAVTVYILIPFLVIPQIILSGIIVKYEKLNPKISSPSKIPVYGEIITARWAYEALMVQQFMNNEYEKEFYPYDKVLSQADFKKNYWIKNLQNKTDFIERNYKNTIKQSIVHNDLIVIYNELFKELNSESGELISFNSLDKLKAKEVDELLIKDLNKYFTQLKRYYITLYNKADKLKDKIITNYQEDELNRSNFHYRKNRHDNEQINKFVKNSEEIERIVEYKGRLYQKIDPIFLDPENKLIKAHFYAPRKKINNTFFSTYWINIIVMWLMAGIFYIVLYYRLLKRLLDLFGKISYNNE